MDGEDISCVAVFPGVDPLEERKLMKSAKFELTGSGGGSSSPSRQRRGDSIKLLDSDDDELTICARNKRSGESFTFEIEFESDPEPESVSWSNLDDINYLVTVKDFGFTQTCLFCFFR